MAWRATGSPDANADYYYGLALAQLGQWDEARSAFLAGLGLAPGDARFAVELGGVAFKQKRYPEAARWLHRALRLQPGDAYSNDLLATIYFVQGNQLAALKYWNRAGKPEIARTRLPAGLRVSPVLLDHAFAFAPATVLRLPDYLSTEERLGGLGIFAAHNLRLEAEPDGTFQTTLDAQEMNGFGEGVWTPLLQTLRGAAYQTIYPSYFNLRGSAVNITSLLRWDAEKRRAQVSLSGPLHGDAKLRYTLGSDLRDENWITGEFAGARFVPGGALNLRREAAYGEVASFASGRWGWSAGAEFSHRDYRDIAPGNALPGGAPGTSLPANVLLAGNQLKAIGQLRADLWNVPERRLDFAARARSETGTIWSSSASPVSTGAQTFEKLNGAVDMHWFPQARGDDYEMQARIGGGKTFGQTPFDELYMLGLERDNDLWLRGHVGTRYGEKGSPPLGRDYALANWEMDKNIYSNGLLTWKLGPFVDTGRVFDPLMGLGPREWLVDTGGQAKLRVLGVEVLFVYGKDLRTGHNSFYVTTSRAAGGGAGR